jgi:hypothetical protein
LELINLVKGNYVAPELGLQAFNCPLCGAYSHQSWSEVFQKAGLFVKPLHEVRLETIKNRLEINGVKPICSISKCYRCQEYAIWEGPSMIHPNELNVEPPNNDMPEDIQSLYNEARSIVNLSAKSAAALLRLGLEKLLIHLGAKKGKIDVMIQDLVDRDIISASGSVRKALDSLRMLGNAGVHPTGIDLDEDPQAAFALFKVLNFVVEKLITEEKEIEAIYAFVPEGKRENLDKRRAK